MFSDSNRTIELTRILGKVTGNVKSNLIYAKSEVTISQLVDRIETKLQ